MKTLIHRNLYFLLISITYWIVFPIAAGAQSIVVLDHSILENISDSSLTQAKFPKTKIESEETFPTTQHLSTHALFPPKILKKESTTFQWEEAFNQSFRFLLIEHAFRLVTESSTRKELKGPFFQDYFESVSHLRGWRDGDPFLVNYIGHPMQGAVTGYIQIHNDPNGNKLEFDLKKAYWKSRLKAMGWSAVYSTQFEIGPLSEATIGNVGKYPSKKSAHPMAFVDLVITPTVGTGLLVGEDLLDKYIIQSIERKTTNHFVRIMVRGFLNPSRSFANLMRFKWPWYRDKRPL